MPAIRRVKRAIIKNNPDAAVLRPGKHRPGGESAIDSTGGGGSLAPPPRSQQPKPRPDAAPNLFVEGYLVLLLPLLTFLLLGGFLLLHYV